MQMLDVVVLSRIYCKSARHDPTNTMMSKTNRNKQILGDAKHMEKGFDNTRTNTTKLKTIEIC